MLKFSRFGTAPNHHHAARADDPDAAGYDAIYRLQPEAVGCYAVTVVPTYDGGEIVTRRRTLGYAATYQEAVTLAQAHADARRVTGA